MKLIALRGKHAVGEHTHAIVDDEDFERLNQWKWKAKPNADGNHVYAVRTQKLPDGRTVDVRMHREVLGYSGPLDVDHINRNALDNRRSNLRAVTRQVNCQNTVYSHNQLACAHCGSGFVHMTRVGLAPATYCSDTCSTKAGNKRRTISTPTNPRTVKCCEWCTKEYEASKPAQRFCCEPCRKAEKWARQRAAGTLPPSAHGSLFSRSREGNRGPELPVVHRAGEWLRVGGEW